MRTLIYILLICSLASCRSRKVNKSVVTKDSVVTQTIDSVAVKTESKESNIEQHQDYERETTVYFDTAKIDSTPVIIVHKDGSLTVKSKVKSVVVKEKGGIKTNQNTIEVKYDSTAKKEDNKTVVHSSAKTVQKEAKPFTWLYIAAFMALLIALFLYAWFTIKKQK